MHEAPNIDGFKILEFLDQSDVTTTWKAYQQSLDRDVILKVLNPSHVQNDEEVSEFLNTAKLSARIDHPNIVSIYDAGRQGDVCYLVMELVNGPTILDLLNKGKPLETAKAIQIAKSVVRALDHAWQEAKIVHRNVTPKNIRIDADGTVMVSYSSIYHRFNPQVAAVTSTTDEIAGTPWYMAPEQTLLEQSLDCRTDMYGLGMSLYHMLTGRLPFGEKDAQSAMESQRSGYLHPPRQLNPTIPVHLNRVLERLLMRHPDMRYRNWQELMQEIERAASKRVVLQRNQIQGDCVIRPPVPIPRAGNRRITIRKQSLSSAAAMSEPTPRKRIVIKR